MGRGRKPWARASGHPPGYKGENTLQRSFAKAAMLDVPSGASLGAHQYHQGQDQSMAVALPDQQASQLAMMQNQAVQQQQVAQHGNMLAAMGQFHGGTQQACGMFQPHLQLPQNQQVMMNQGFHMPGAVGVPHPFPQFQPAGGQMFRSGASPVGLASMSLTALQPSAIPGMSAPAMAKTPEQLEVETLRKTLAVFLTQGRGGVCGNYIAFGAKWYHGEKKTLARKFKIVCIRFLNPKVWGPLRLSLLSETEIDQLLFVLAGVKPQANPKDMNFQNKYAVFEMIAEQHELLAASNSERISKLSVALDNIGAVAEEYGYPRKYLPPPGYQDDCGEAPAKSGLTPKQQKRQRRNSGAEKFPGTHVTIDELGSDEDDSDDEEKEPAPPKRIRSKQPFPESHGTGKKQQAPSKSLAGLCIRRPQLTDTPVAIPTPVPVAACEQEGGTSGAKTMTTIDPDQLAKIIEHVNAAKASSSNLPAQDSDQLVSILSRLAGDMTQKAVG